MSTTAPVPASRPTPSADHKVIKARYLQPNSWNPNRMTKDMYAKAIESIKTYGFIDPLLVWEVAVNDYLIIDGEHRFKAGRALSYDEFPCMVISGITEADAKKLTIVMNELHGQADPTKLGDLLNDILAATDLDALMVGLPYDPDQLSSLLGSPLPELPPLTPAPPPGSAEDGSKTTWVERLYRMPKEVALVVDEAIEKAKADEEIEQWQALERVAAEYLAS